MDNKVGNFIRDKRKENGITLRDLQEHTGISFSHLSKVERGEHQPTRETLEILANALAINKYELFLLAGYSTDQDMIYWEEVLENLNPDWGIDKEDYYEDGVPNVVKFRNDMVHGKFDSTIHNKLRYYFWKERLVSHISSSVVKESDTNNPYSEYQEWGKVRSELDKRGYTPTDLLNIINFYEDLKYKINKIK